MKSKQFFNYLAIGVLFFMLTKLHSQSFCPNLNFGMGNFTNWQTYTGSCLNGNDTIYSSQTISGKHTIMDAQQLYQTNDIKDTYCDSILKVPLGFNYAAKLGNDSARTKINALEYTMTIDSNNFFLIVHFAFVLENSQNYNLNERPKFTMQLRDSLGNPLTNFACGNIEFIADTGLQDLVCTGDTVARDWTTVAFNLDSLIGQTIKIYFETRDGTQGNHFGYAYVVAECRPTRMEIAYCSGQAVSRLSAPQGFAWYRWTRSSDISWIREGNESTARQIAVPNLLDGEILTCEMTSALGDSCTATISVIIAKTSVNVDFVLNWYDTCTRTATFLDLSTVKNSKKDNILWEIFDTAKRILKISTDSLLTYTFPDPVDNNPVIYRIRLTVYAENGCIDTSSQYIIIYPSSKIEIEGENEICEGIGQWLKAKAVRGKFVNHTWNWIDTNGITHAVTGDSTKIYTTGTYTLLSKDTADCIARDSVKITLIKPKFNSMEIWNVNCYGEATGSFIHGALYGGQSPYMLFTWTLKDKNGNDSVVNANIYFGEYYGLMAGTYRFNAIDSRGCAMQGDIEIKQNDSLKIVGEQEAATPDLNDGKLKLSASGGVLPYKFRVEKEDGTLISTFNTATNLTTGIYRIIVIDAVNCVTSDTISVLEKVNVSEVINRKFSIVVYPNPANTELYIRHSSQETIDYIIYSIVGQIILHGKLLNDFSTINIESLATGMYYLKISGEENRIIKIIKK